MITYDDVEAGTEIPARTYDVARLDLVKYAGASGDFNPIHWNERFAKSVDLPDVIAHGMMTMAQGGKFLSDWAGDPGAVLEYGVRFTGMVVVSDEIGGSIEITGRVDEKLDDNKVAVSITASSAGTKVLGRAKAVVRLP